MVLLLILCACSSHRRADGWYPVADYPDNSVVGEAVATVADFDDIEMLRNSLIADGDTTVMLFIRGRVKPEKRHAWADATEKLIGRRLGFVFDGCVVAAPQINTRMESGSFEINSPDTVLLENIYNSIKKEIKQ